MIIYLFLANNVVSVSETAIISQSYQVMLRHFTEHYPLQQAHDEARKTQRRRSFVTNKNEFNNKYLKTAYPKTPERTLTSFGSLMWVQMKVCLNMEFLALYLANQEM